MSGDAQEGTSTNRQQVQMRSVRAAGESREGSVLTTMDISTIVAEVLRQTGVPSHKEPGDHEQEGQGSRSSGTSSG